MIKDTIDANSLQLSLLLVCLLKTLHVLVDLNLVHFIWEWFIFLKVDSCTCKPHFSDFWGGGKKK